MRSEFLGDSYDLVKRFLADSLSSIAPIYADETFVPEKIREVYTKITGIPIFNSTAGRPFAIFLDPCTGVPSPKHTSRKPTQEHAPLAFIVDVFEKCHPEFLVCFDQSYSRGSDKVSCMANKRDLLAANGLRAFYYTSHANFLFVAESEKTVNSIRKQLTDAGIPGWRLTLPEH